LALENFETAFDSHRIARAQSHRRNALKLIYGLLERSTDGGLARQSILTTS
jgi:hypothetical protein